MNNIILPDTARARINREYRDLMARDVEAARENLALVAQAPAPDDSKGIFRRMQITRRETRLLAEAQAALEQAEALVRADEASMALHTEQHAAALIGLDQVATEVEAELPGYYSKVEAAFGPVREAIQELRRYADAAAAKFIQHLSTLTNDWPTTQRITNMTLARIRAQDVETAESLAKALHELVSAASLEDKMPAFLTFNTFRDFSKASALGETGRKNAQAAAMRLREVLAMNGVETEQVAAWRAAFGPKAPDGAGMAAPLDAPAQMTFEQLQAMHHGRPFSRQRAAAPSEYWAQPTHTELTPEQLRAMYPGSKVVTS